MNITIQIINIYLKKLFLNLNTAIKMDNSQTKSAKPTENSSARDGAAAVDDDVKSQSSDAKRQANLRALEARRRAFRRTLQQYGRIKKRFSTQITKLTSKTEADKGADKDDSGKADAKAAKPIEDPKKALVIAAYRLLRNFCISYNTLTLSKEDDR